MEPQQFLELGFIKANDDFLIDGNHRQMHPAWELLEAFLGRCVCRDIVGCEIDPRLRKKLFRRFARASGRCGVRALPEVVGSDGRSGRLVPPRDPAAMAAAISDILAEPGRCEAMGQAARNRIKRVFRWSDAAAQLAEVFEETIRAAHGRSRAA